MTRDGRYLMLYVPVLHKGYIDLFRKYFQRVDGLYIFGRSIIKEFSRFDEEIRAVEPQTMRRIILASGFFKTVGVLGHPVIDRLRGSKIITANEEICKKVVNKYFQECAVRYDTAFLRWDEARVLSQKPVVYDSISMEKFDIGIMKLAQEESENSSDWWRHVGAVLVINEKPVIIKRNLHPISQTYVYSFGDIRDFLESGEQSDLSSTIHAEKAVIYEAAKTRTSTDGASIYTTVFPCPDCARGIAYSGIKKVFYATGCASFDGEQVLRAYGVEIIFVKMESE